MTVLTRWSSQPLLSESLVQVLNVLYPLGRGHPVPHDLDARAVRSEVLFCVQNRQDVPMGHPR